MLAVLTLFLIQKPILISRRVLINWQDNVVKFFAFKSTQEK